MSRSYNSHNNRKKHYHSDRAPIQYQKEVIIPIHQAYFSIPRVNSGTCVKVRFYHLGKSYSLSVFGKPDREIITLIYQHIQGKRYGARSSTESIASSRELNRTKRSKSSSSSSSPSLVPAASSYRLRQKTVSTKRSKSSSSSSSPSLVPAASSYRSRKNSKCAFGIEQPPLLVRVDSLPRSSTPVRIPTPDTEPLSDKSSPRSRLSTPARRLFSSSSDDNSGKGQQPVNQSRAGQSLSNTLENLSASLLGDSQESKFFLWDTETIPVKVIYTRAGQLYENHIKAEFSKPKTKRKFRDLESFTDQAEEDLVTERLAFEYYQAQRLGYSHLPLCDLPTWYSNAFIPKSNKLYLQRLRITLNTIRSLKLDSTLDNNVEFYWYLNHKGHSLYLSELANRKSVTYIPSIYRQRIIAQTIAEANEFRKTNDSAPSPGRNVTF